MFAKWKKVYLGHYHNHHEITKDIVHLPSFMQDGFGEDNVKGFALLCNDGGYKLIEGKFKEFVKFSIDLNEVTNKEISKLIEAHKGSVDTIRIEFNGTSEQCKALDKTQFKNTGIDIKLKYEELYESNIVEPSRIVERYDKGQIMDSLKEFCKDKSLDYNEGSKLIKEFLNK